jgi:hypothetical protein
MWPFTGILFYVTGAQPKHKAGLDSLKLYVKSKVIELMHSPKYSKNYKNQFRNDKFQFISYCKFKAGKYMDCKDILDSVYIPKTSSDVAYNINYVNDSIIVLPFFYSPRSGSLFIDNAITNLGDISDNDTYNVYKLARKTSKYCFVLRVFQVMVIQSVLKMLWLTLMATNSK